jgi:hypothetical protein
MRNFLYRANYKRMDGYYGGEPPEDPLWQRILWGFVLAVIIGHIIRGLILYFS